MKRLTLSNEVYKLPEEEGVYVFYDDGDTEILVETWKPIEYAEDVMRLDEVYLKKIFINLDHQEEDDKKENGVQEQKIVINCDDLKFKVTTPLYKKIDVSEMSKIGRIVGEYEEKFDCRKIIVGDLTLHLISCAKYDKVRNIVEVQVTDDFTKSKGLIVDGQHIKALF